MIVLDVAKGALAGFAGLAIGDAAAYAAGTGVIAGHCWPVYNGFRGGKGVASAGGSFFAVFPPMVPIDGLATATVAFVGRSSRLAIKAALIVWVVSAGRVVGGRSPDVVGSGARPRAPRATRCWGRG